MLLIPSHRRHGSVHRNGISWELPLGMLQISAPNSPVKNKKTSLSSRAAIAPFGTDQKHPQFSEHPYNPSS
jgi:hypothetical protein